ncbi:hypothetical protein COT75_04670 [Candidatus Beckwithbacteria bacterium CG10_big_fil_rev_8_21_14_0_10_34_10]|uniref:Peptidase S9 prolyl oligopeptidase catalytic domain-containing protein n=1 Tax=Candidatus Beckwithbacteria bacterium CG10_big_fil_rev_8_21_14_0_10_34_10 TaxID=1974495 RepID=A0A2H0W7Y6_9BACT|nr:MAG: hypothetical protein COT75_04670 [Candidatus Beckwithbacteria bacterium CG10_big_fil_rev_8_21_14_0_10_34_10]
MFKESLSRKKIVILSFLSLFLIIGLVFFLLSQNKSFTFLSPLAKKSKTEEIKEKPLDKYTFKRLKKRKPQVSEITLESTINETPDFTSYIFTFESEGRKISGMANIPFGEGPFPVILMLRGYVDLEIYQSGMGTQPSAEVYAQNGYLTLAPDFLGYGSSDMPPDDIWESRFLRSVNIIDLLNSIKTFPQAEVDKIAIWGHSNGGLSSLSILEITGGEYPTTLWAPVSQFFPYDILFFTNEYDDKGKGIRKSLAEFEKDYDIDLYSFDEYLDWIEAPIQIHQGTADIFVPLIWSQNLVNNLNDFDKEVVFYTYPGADHQLNGAWDLVVQRDLNFFKERLK